MGRKRKLQELAAVWAVDTTDRHLEDWNRFRKWRHLSPCIHPHRQEGVGLHRFPVPSSPLSRGDVPNILDCELFHIGLPKEGEGAQDYMWNMNVGHKENVVMPVTSQPLKKPQGIPLKAFIFRCSSDQHLNIDLVLFRSRGIDCVIGMIFIFDNLTDAA